MNPLLMLMLSGNLLAAAAPAPSKAEAPPASARAQEAGEKGKNSKAFSSGWTAGETYESELGTETVVVAKPTGFLFIKGRYIEPPYTFVRRGRCLFVNDYLLAVGIWPYPPVQTQPPSVPPSINKNTDQYDLRYTKYLWALWDWALTTSPNDNRKAMEMVVAELKKCPNVKEAAIPAALDGPDNSVIITLHNNREEGVRLDADTRKSKEEAIAELKGSFANYVTDAQDKENGIYFLTAIGDNMGCILMLEAECHKLKMLTTILRSNLDDATKVALLGEMDYYKGISLDVNDRVCIDLFKNFNPPQAFYDKLEKTLKKDEAYPLVLSLPEMLARHAELSKYPPFEEDAAKYHERWEAITQQIIASRANPAPATVQPPKGAKPSPSIP